MNFYTFYTPSHEEIYKEYFLKSFPHDEFNLVAREFDQECGSASYRDEGWNLTMHKKVKLVLEGIDGNMGNYITYGDCDIQFFPPGVKDALLEEVENYDIAFQDDGPAAVCAGFFICKASPQTKQLFSEISHQLDALSSAWEALKDPNVAAPDDQLCLNNILPSQTYVKHKRLSSRFYTAARDNNWQIYQGFGEIKVSTPEILMHHANYTKGLFNKIKLLNTVRSHYG